jgi:hypothetical protein
MSRGRWRCRTAVQKFATSAMGYLLWYTLWREKWIGLPQNFEMDTLVSPQRNHTVVIKSPAPGQLNRGGGGDGEERAAKGQPKEAATVAAAAGAAAARRAAGPRGGVAESPSREGGDGGPDGPPGRGGGCSRGMV